MATKEGTKIILRRSKEELLKISREIFGNLPINNIPTGNKILKKQLKGDKIVSWWPKEFTKSLSRNNEYNRIVNEDRVEEIDKMRRKGKGPPKKGSGKRSKKK